MKTTQLIEELRMKKIQLLQLGLDTDADNMEVLLDRVKFDKNSDIFIRCLDFMEKHYTEIIEDQPLYFDADLLL